MHEEDIPIYIAIEDQQMIGFTSFDVYHNKKRIFGMMGVSKANRVQGVGFTLLHYCLQEMKEIGYAYAIFGEAGLIKFYKKACHAVVIPKSF